MSIAGCKHQAISYCLRHPIRLTSFNQLPNKHILSPAHNGPRFPSSVRRLLHAALHRTCPSDCLLAWSRWRHALIWPPPATSQPVLGWRISWAPVLFQYYLVESRVTDYLFGLQLSPPSSGRAICQPTIARVFWPLWEKNGLNIPYWPAYKTALFFLAVETQATRSWEWGARVWWLVYILIMVRTVSSCNSSCKAGEPMASWVCSSTNQPAGIKKREKNSSGPTEHTRFFFFFFLFIWYGFVSGVSICH